MENEKKPFDKVAYNNAFIAEAYDRINLTVPKGKKEVYRAFAEAHGEKLNTFIQRAMEERVDRMKRETPAEARELPTDGEKPPGGCTPIPRILYK